MTKKTLNIGCGNRIYKEYPKGYTCVNLDIRPLEGVDIVGNVEAVDLPNEQFDYILASDIIEHFPISKTIGLLKEWARLLKHGGVMEIRTPNMQWAVEYYRQTGDAKFVSYHMFGGQDYPGNFHFVMFDVKWLSNLCIAANLIPSNHSFEGSNFILEVYKK
ncbi:MAG TPA: class I SAM-dependent methyltransferase [Patescibacteria group bacterium]|nr:class I SAM-dependent methyltransferase [Patescibacteria group bacterium]